MNESSGRTELGAFKITSYRVSNGERSVSKKCRPSVSTLFFSFRKNKRRLIMKNFQTTCSSSCFYLSAYVLRTISSEPYFPRVRLSRLPAELLQNLMHHPGLCVVYFMLIFPPINPH